MARQFGPAREQLWFTRFQAARVKKLGAVRKSGAALRMDWIQIHLALNHVPIIGLPILVLLLIAGWWRQSDDLIRSSLWSVTLLAGAAIAIKFTGDFAAEQSPGQFTPVKEFVSRHEEASDQATTGVFLVGLAAVLALFLARQGRRVRAWSIGLVVLLGLLTELLYARVGHTGGQISHPELRAPLALVRKGGNNLATAQRGLSKEMPALITNRSADNP